MKLADLGVRRLSVEISTLCNIRCSFCPIDHRSAPTQFMKLEDVQKILDQLAADGSLELVGLQFLNEPLLHPQIEEILNYAHRLGLRTFVCTNGTILTPPLIDMLARTPPTLMKVSVQDVNPKTFKVVKGTKMDIDEFLKRVANLIRRRLTDAGFTSRIELDIAVPIRQDKHFFIRNRSWLQRVLGVSFVDRTINNADRALLDNIVQFLKYLEREAGAPIEWDRFNPDFYHTKTWTEDYTPTARLGKGITLELKAFMDWIGIDQKKPITYSSCPRLNHLVINYKGEFQLCCIDTHGKTAIGNVFQNSIAEILSQPTGLAKILRASGFEIPTEHCRKCLGAPTARGVALLNLSNRFRLGFPRFVPEQERNAESALHELRERELKKGSPAVAAAIEEVLGN